MNQWINITKKQPPGNIMLMLKTNEIIKIPTIIPTAIGGIREFVRCDQEILTVILPGVKINEQYYILYRNKTNNFLFEEFKEQYNTIVYWKYYDDNITSKNIIIPPIIKNNKFLDLD